MILNDATPSDVIEINNIEIVIDQDHHDRVELYILSPRGERLEGGTFSKDAFMCKVLEFYNQNY